MRKKIVSLVLALCMFVSMLPTSAFAVSDASGRPLDLDDPVYLSLHVHDDTTAHIPGEPAQDGHTAYKYFGGDFNIIEDEVRPFADAASEVFDKKILDDMIQNCTGNIKVWGHFDLEGLDQYISNESGIQDNAKKMIRNASKKFENIENYEILWYVIKYQKSDSAWFLNGVIRQKGTVAVSFNGNGSTDGFAPNGDINMAKGHTYIVPGNTGNLVREIGSDKYTFMGWNDGRGNIYHGGEQITVDSDITFYAEWHLDNHYRARVVTMLNGEAANMTDLYDSETALFLQKEGETDYIPMQKVVTGVYDAFVSENGNYHVFYRDKLHHTKRLGDYKVIIYNNNATLSIPHYSVSYVPNGGEWAEGKDPGKLYHLAAEDIAVVDEIPVRPGYSFTGWMDQTGNIFQPGDIITDAIGLKKERILTAQWQENINIKVNVVINHKAVNGEVNPEPSHDLTFRLEKKKENGLFAAVDMPMTVTPSSHERFTYAYNNDVTTYTAVGATFPDIISGEYTLSTSKFDYILQSVTSTTDANGDVTLQANFVYEPGDFYIDFEVKVDEESSGYQDLYPQAVNVRVQIWEDDQWKLIPAHGEGTAPVVVPVDPTTGIGHGQYPVLKYRTENGAQVLNHYRITVTSVRMPDGTVALMNTADSKIYTMPGAEPNGSFYVGTNQVPGSDKEFGGLPAVHFQDSVAKMQNALPTFSVKIQPHSVTFDANGGKINGQDSYTVEGLYRVPNLGSFVPTFENHTFVEWQPVANLLSTEGYLKGDMTYQAVWNSDITVEGTVKINGFFDLNGVATQVQLDSRAQEALVRLQHWDGTAYRNVQEQIVKFDEDYLTNESNNVGTATYRFENVPNDGTHRIEVYQLNYGTRYDNEADADPDCTAEEYIVVTGDDGVATVNVLLLFEPDSYDQSIVIDASMISSAFRPTQVYAEVLHRDLGSLGSYKVNSQHREESMKIWMDYSGMGYDSASIWNWHTDGKTYQYQVNVSSVYQNSQKLEIGSGAPYRIAYGNPTHYDAATEGPTGPLYAFLIPRTYEIRFEVNAGNETVTGMDDFIVDDGDGMYYAASHTWSHLTEVEAVPSRDDYIFAGWEVNEEDASLVNIATGKVKVQPACAKNITLRAKWEPIDTNIINVRIHHVDANTPTRLLRGDTFVLNVDSATVISPKDVVVDIPNFQFSKMVFNGNEVDSVTGFLEGRGEYEIFVHYSPRPSSGIITAPEDNLFLNKTAILEDDGTYTIQMEVYSTANPVSTHIRQDTPMDIVMVLDQSGSMSMASGHNQFLDKTREALEKFVNQIADHGYKYGVDHRIALVGFASNEGDGHSGTDLDDYPVGGGYLDSVSSSTNKWLNTGIFDSNGDFYTYPTTGFNYTAFTGNPDSNNDYYCTADGQYEKLQYHQVYYHPLTLADAQSKFVSGVTIYGRVDTNSESQYHVLGQNAGGAWTYNGGAEIYSGIDLYTQHTDVWTHRHLTEERQIHAYGTGSSYREVEGHSGLFTRTSTTNSGDADVSIYYDALVPVSNGQFGTGYVNPNLIDSARELGANGATRTQYGIEMANRIFAAHNTAEDQERVRVMVVFTDGEPGQSGFLDSEANAALAKAYVTKNTYGAHVYTVGLYPSDGVDDTDDIGFFMNGLSSNYLYATKMDDVQSKYKLLSGNTTLSSRNNNYYVEVDGLYYRLTRSFSWSSFTYKWSITVNDREIILSTADSPSVKVINAQGYQVYQSSQNVSYAPAQNTGYYQTSNNVNDLTMFFHNVVQDITNKISYGVELHEDTIVRDIMADGFVLTNDTVITVSEQKGTYNPADPKNIIWANSTNQIARLEVDLETTTASDEKATVIIGGKEQEVPMITLYNTNESNTVEAEFAPHAVDVTGYPFNDNYINDSHPEGAKLIVTITRVEAQDSVEWSRAVSTNHHRSGLWQPMDASGKRELLQAFNEPKTIFVERAYVLDYAKPFTMDKWYFDKTDTSGAVHVDINFDDGMNGFDTAAPSQTATTRFGSVAIADNLVTYTPTKMNWDDYDQFYIFGDTNSSGVKAQSANTNGNLWSKITVIPANSIYYEDTFVTDEETDTVGIEFSDGWTTDFSNGEQSADQNKEHAESTEEKGNDGQGGVHGWTNDLADDNKYSDGSAHASKFDGVSASATFTFTGTGCDIYSRTNRNTGLVIATLSKLVTITDEEGQESTELKAQSMLMMDNLSMSGDYYGVPTLSFGPLEYGTYQVTLRVTKASAAATGEPRLMYYLDGIRVYNPLGNDQNETSNQPGADSNIKDAYGYYERNPVFTEVRDILLDYGSIYSDGDFSGQAMNGAVFIDWIRPEEGNNNDMPGDGEQTEDTEAEDVAAVTYKIGTFEAIGPKNEVYLQPGQSVAFRVDYASGNYYFVGLKSLTGSNVTAALSSASDGTIGKYEISISHSTDQYYALTPDEEGYVVISNASPEGSGSVLSITKLRKTNPDEFSADSGILPVVPMGALQRVAMFAMRPVVQPEPLLPPVDPDVPAEPVEPEIPVEPENPEEPEEPKVDVDIQNPEDHPETEGDQDDDTDDDSSEIENPIAEALREMIQKMFSAVQLWLRK